MVGLENDMGLNTKNTRAVIAALVSVGVGGGGLQGAGEREREFACSLLIRERGDKRKMSVHPHNTYPHTAKTRGQRNQIDFHCRLNWRHPLQTKVEDCDLAECSVKCPYSYKLRWPAGIFSSRHKFLAVVTNLLDQVCWDFANVRN